MEELYKNTAKRLSSAWLRNLLDEATKSSELIGEGGRGVVKVESRKWEVRIRSSIFALQKSTFDFDFSICELTFYFVNSHLIFDFDFSLWRSTFGFDFLLSMATLGRGKLLDTENPRKCRVTFRLSEDAFVHIFELINLRLEYTLPQSKAERLDCTFVAYLSAFQRNL